VNGVASSGRGRRRGTRASAGALVRNYPPLLRDAGIGGTPVVWFLIDEDGRVLRTQLSRPSGYAALDEAALAVARMMRFSPALNRDRRVQVWVEIPIVFTAR
jgi:periplasmic protein TonB